MKKSLRFSAVFPAMRNAGSHASAKMSFAYLLAFCLLGLAGSVQAQEPTVFYLQGAAGNTNPAPTGTDRFNLNDRGAFRQIRLEATGAIAAPKYAFHIGTAASPDYNDNWRPYTAGDAAVGNFPGFNTVVNPAALNSARYNSSGGGTDGNLPAMTMGRWYTVNIKEGGGAVNKFMSITETNFNPQTIVSVAPPPTCVIENDAVLISVTLSADPDPNEHVYIRYSSDNFTTSSIADVTMFGATGAGIIPGASSGTTIKYYVFTSTLEELDINAQVFANGENAYDMLSLEISGAPQMYTVTGVPVDCPGTTLMTQAQVDAYRNMGCKCTHVSGSLTITAGVTDPITDLSGLDRITEIDGSLTVTALTDGANPVDLGGLVSLESVGGDLTINNTMLIDASLPLLNSVGGSLTIQNNESLGSADMPNVGTGLSPSVVNLTIDNNLVLLSFALDQLQEVTSSVSLTNNPLLTSHSFVSLTNIGSDLTVSAMDALFDLDGFGSLSQLGGQPDDHG